MLHPTSVPTAGDARVATSAVVVLLLIASMTGAAPAQTAPDPAPARTTPAEPAATSDVDHGTGNLPATPTSLRRPIFVCEDSGIPVFSDRPCGAAITPRTVSFAAPPAGAVASTLPPAPRAGTKPQPVAVRGPGDVAASRCASLRRQLEELDDRMRTGYTSREAARLWNRWREIKTRLRTERC